jgi:hypothetical protein
MDDEYISIQKEIEKILKKTNKKKTGKSYQEMLMDEKHRSSIKKIGKLMMELEKYD